MSVIKVTVRDIRPPLLRGWRVKGTPLCLFLLEVNYLTGEALLAPADRRPIVKQDVVTATTLTGKLVEAFAYRGVAAWRVAPARSAPANARIPHPLLYSTSFESFLKIRALRAILVKSARYARSTWPAARYARASILLPK